MNSTKFTKPPLSNKEREKKAEDFLNFSSSRSHLVKDVSGMDKKNNRVFKKEPVKALALRFPVSLAEDITEISAITGLSKNAVCVELLRPSIKEKLKLLKE